MKTQPALVGTNGSIEPQKAVEEAADLLIQHLSILVTQKTDDVHDTSDSIPDDPELARKLGRNVEELELSVRAANCLKSAGIKTIGDLVCRSEADRLQYHNFGKKSLDEIKSVLTSMGLSLGMKFGDISHDVPNEITQQTEEE